MALDHIIVPQGWLPKEQVLGEDATARVATEADLAQVVGGWWLYGLGCGTVLGGRLCGSSLPHLLPFPAPP